MKKITTVKEFYDAIGEIAREIGQDYWSVKVQLNTHCVTEYTAYINGYNYTDGRMTPEEAVQLMRYMVLPLEAVNHDINL